jgi:hypothetical protein
MNIAIRQIAKSRAQNYVEKFPAAISGQGGHNQTFAAATALIHGFALSESDAWPILLEYNRRCDPPWSDTELRHKLKDATHSAGHKRPPGHLLTRPTPGTQIARSRSIQDHSLPDLSGLLGQVRLRDLPEIPESTPKRETAKEREDTPPEQGAESPNFDVPSPNSAAPDASPAILDPPSSIPFDELRAYGSDLRTTNSAATPAGVGRPGPTIQLPRAINGSLKGFIDPRTDPEREWLHIQGYMSIPPKNCPICWLRRGRSLWIGSCYCSSATLT